MSLRIIIARMLSMTAILAVIASSSFDLCLRRAVADETNSVPADASEIERTIKQLLPDSQVKITIVKSLAVLTGTVASNEEHQLVWAVAEQYFENRISRIKLANSVPDPKKPSTTKGRATGAAQRQRNRGRASTNDAERMLDEVRNIRQDVQRLSELVERKLVEIGPTQGDKLTRKPSHVKKPSDSLLFFTANWSSQCQQMQAIVERLKGQEHSIQTIDIDNEAELAKRYNVRSIPSFVVVVDGNVIDQVTGMTAEDRLQEMLGKLKPSGATAQDRLQLALSKRLSRFECDAIPLDQALKQLQEQMDVNIGIGSQGLLEEGVTPTSLVRKISVKNVSCRMVLQLLLEPLNLTFVVDNEVIFITSRQRALGNFNTAVYPVDDILKRSSTQTADGAAEELIKSICSTVSPDSWDNVGGPGSLQYTEAIRSLIVRQTQSAHAEIADLLQQMRNVQQREMKKQQQASPIGIVPAQFTTEAATKLRPDEPVVVTYAVADLVVPMPGIDREGETALAMKWLALIDKIKETISPSAWDKNGGRCSITSNKATFSLGIRATARMHEQIAEMFAGMRREQDVQMTLEIQVMTGADHVAIKKSGLKFGFDEKTHAAKLTWQEADRLVKSVNAQNDGRRFAPKITLFDGQLAQLLPDFFKEKNAGLDDLHLYLRGKVTPDSKHVRLNLAVNPRDLVEDLTRHSLQVANDSPVLFDMTEAAARDKPANPRERLWVLLRPRIIIMDDEEETATIETEKKVVDEKVSPVP